MPDYDFSQCSNPECPEKQTGKQVFYVIRCPMAKATPIGHTIPCPGCGVGEITRLASLPAVIVRQADGLRTTGDRFTTKLNGQETHIQFIDHQHTDPQHESAMVEAARRSGISGAYFNEKQGRVCVDVASNIRDPLGAIKRAEHVVPVSEKTNIATPVKTRKVNRKAKANTTLKPYIPVRNH